MFMAPNRNTTHIKGWIYIFTCNSESYMVSLLFTSTFDRMELQAGNGVSNFKRSGNQHTEQGCLNGVKLCKLPNAVWSINNIDVSSSTEKMCLISSWNLTIWSPFLFLSFSFCSSKEVCMSYYSLVFNCKLSLCPDYMSSLRRSYCLLSVIIYDVVQVQVRTVGCSYFYHH